ncbi:hypothetical protein O3M35_010428 [Rhynocoris fuscipes]|uniref:chitinase n=1 Tax=Rhynocoris fuscipes TaxID=488301 RepID=A0AAW1D5X2_9HEMI
MIHPKIIILMCFLMPFSIAQLADKKVVCYYTDWSVYRPDSAQFWPRDINPNICTHLIYAFAKFSDDGGIAAFDEWQDITRNGFRDFNEVKALNENVKTLLAIGGWIEGSKTFSRIAAMSERREKFADSVVMFLRKHNFDGINLDWQFPGFREGSREEDFDNYVALVKDLRETFENESMRTNMPRLIVTLSVPSDLEYIENGYDLVNLQRYADFINILCYDYHLSYDPFVNHHSPLYALPEETGSHPNSNLNVESTIKYLLEKGVRKDILNLGIPTFGRTFILEDPNNNGLGAPASGQGQEGEATRTKGYKAYYEICREIKEDNWTVVYVNRTAMGPYAYKDKNWVGFDDEFIVRKKAEYARDIGLGGIMFWTIDDDDFRGVCGSRGNPLIKAGREAFLAPGPSMPLPTPRGTVPPMMTPRGTKPPVIMPPVVRPSPIMPPAAPPSPMMPPVSRPVRPPAATSPPKAAQPPVANPIPNFPGFPTFGDFPFPPAASPPVASPPAASPPVASPPAVSPPLGSPPSSGNPIRPIHVSNERHEGGVTYYQNITLWIINNIFNFNFPSN